MREVRRLGARTVLHDHNMIAETAEPVFSSSSHSQVLVWRNSCFADRNVAAVHAEQPSCSQA